MSKFAEYAARRLSAAIDETKEYEDYRKAANSARIIKRMIRRYRPKADGFSARAAIRECNKIIDAAE